MPNKAQVKLIQTAVRAAGLRVGTDDGRYRLLLAQYRQSNGKPVTSCIYLSNHQIDDFLAICESLGWQYPGKAKNHFRNKIALKGDLASYGQQSAVEHLAGDLGWDEHQLGGMLERMTDGKVNSVVALSASQAYKVIEALKSMLGRQTGRKYGNLKAVKSDMEVTDGTKKQEDKPAVQVG